MSVDCVYLFLQFRILEFLHEFSFNWSRPWLSVFAAAPVAAQDVDFGRFLTTAAGASGVAAALTGLGSCDTEIWHGYAYDEATGSENKDHLYFACQYYDKEDEQMYDKSVVAKFQFWDKKAVLESLTYLP